MIFSKDPAVWLKDLFLDAGLNNSLSSFLSTLGLVVIVIILSWLSNIIAKAIIRKVVARIVKKSKSQWDDIIFEHKVFTRLSHFAPAMVIWFMSGWALKSYTFWLTLVHNLNYIYMLSIGMIVILSFIDAWHEIYLTLPIARHRNIKGYVELVRIMVILITLLIIISVVFKKDISTIIAGLGAIAAVLILVFKDTLLGFIGSIQLSANKMLKPGDWITIPDRDVDGIVTDITLNTVKIQNFDKTIITVPTYALVQESFQNWNGMEEAGIRRIKRPILIDIRSIRFLDDKLKEKLFKIPALKEYIESYEKADRIDEENKQFFSYNALTNLGLFRYYAEAWLRSHPLITGDQTVILRHRTPGEHGLPLEIYVFSRDIKFIGYEKLQNEIFEHLLAIMGEFDLKVFQSLTGEDQHQSQETKSTD
jgi:miniconductance mechanosensitive channel